MLHELEAAAARLNVQVSYEALQASIGAGGMCRVRGQMRIIIDKRAQLGERIATIAQGLARLAASSVELGERARDLVRQYAQPRAS